MAKPPKQIKKKAKVPKKPREWTITMYGDNTATYYGEKVYNGENIRVREIID